MTRHSLLLFLLLIGCGPAQRAQNPSPIAPQPARPAQGTTDLSVDLEGWLSELRASLPQGAAAVDSTLERLGSAPPQESQSRSEACDEPMTIPGEVERLEGQLDDDPELEVVVRATLGRSELMGQFERCEEVWLGVFDPTERGHRFVGALRRTLYFCDYTDSPSALLQRFSDDDGPGLRLEEQRVNACGTLIDFDWQIERLSLRDGALQLEPLGRRDGFCAQRTRPGEEGLCGGES